MIKYKVGDEMSNFILHFFKERNRFVDHERLFSFLENFQEISIRYTEEEASEFKIEYRHDVLEIKADFILSRKSAVRNIHKINPLYLDVNFRVEIPTLTPAFSASIVLDVVDKLCKEFGFLVYNDLFEDALPFRREVIEKVFQINKQKFKDQFSYKMPDYYYYSPSKLTDCLKYVNEQYELHRFYKEQDIYVPHYYIVKDEEDKVHFTIEWTENTKTIFPPHIDYIYYRQGLETTLLPYDEVMAKIEKYTTNVPGFIEHTKVVEPKMLKRITKAIKKAKFTAVKGPLFRIELTQVIDI